MQFWQLHQMEIHGQAICEFLLPDIDCVACRDQMNVSAQFHPQINQAEMAELIPWGIDLLTPLGCYIHQVA